MNMTDNDFFDRAAVAAMTVYATVAEELNCSDDDGDFVTTKDVARDSCRMARALLAERNRHVTQAGELRPQEDVERNDG